VTKICHKYEGNVECFYENALLGLKAFFSVPQGDSSRNVEFLFCSDKIARNVKQSLALIVSRTEE